MKPTARVLALVLSCAAAFSLSAQAGVPVPWNSDIDPRLVACPAGDSLFRVITRDCCGPEPNTVVTLKMCGCPEAHIAPSGGYTISGCSVSAVSNQSGIADFYLRAGGACAGASIFLDAGGFPFDTLTFMASPDQDGNLIVNDADIAVISARVGTSDDRADLDGDGAVTSADLAVAEGHLGHAAAGAVDVPVIIPGGFQLRLAGPNPSRGETRLAIDLPFARRVTVEALDTSGRLVHVLIADREFAAGAHTVVWDGRDGSGARVSAGVYFLRVRAGMDRGHARIVFVN